MLLRYIVFQFLQVALVTDRARLPRLLAERELRLSLFKVLRVDAEQALVGGWLRVVLYLHRVLLCALEPMERLRAGEALDAGSLSVAAIADMTIFVH